MTLDEVRERVIQASQLKSEDIQGICEKAKAENKIPKLIHFCFYGWRDIPEMYLHFLKTWFETLPDDYTYINWCAENIDHSSCKWLEDKWAKKRYAFLADYIRAWAVCNFGGWYFDCDVLCHRDVTELENYDYVFGQECWLEYRERKLSFECGVFGAKPNNQFLKCVIDKYSDCLNEEIAPTKYVDIIKRNGYNIIALNNINGYQSVISNDKKSIYLLDSKYFSNSNIPGMQNKDYRLFKLIPEQYTSHEFSNSWCGGNGQRIKDYFGIRHVEVRPQIQCSGVVDYKDHSTANNLFQTGQTQEKWPDPEGVHERPIGSRLRSHASIKAPVTVSKTGRIRIRRH